MKALVPPLTILMYHAVVRTPLAVPDWCFLDVANFRSQMEVVARTRRTRPLSEAVGRPASVESPGPIAVTFDDGFLNTYEEAFPILRELGIPATMFVNTGYLDSSDTLWFCKINRAIARTALDTLSWRGETCRLASQEERSAASATLQRRLKDFAHPELLREVSSLCADLGTGADAPVSSQSPYAILNVEAMRAMSSTGLVEFGAHTHTHAILSRLDVDQQREEILQSVTGLEALGGVRTCSVFAYPNGRQQDFGSEAVSILQAAGVTAAVTAVQGINSARDSWMALRRFGIGPEISLDEFEGILADGAA